MFDPSNNELTNYHISEKTELAQLSFLNDYATDTILLLLSAAPAEAGKQRVVVFSLNG